MIVRTYGRRNRGVSRTFSDSLDAEDDTGGFDSLSSQEANHKDFGSFNFSSQESSSIWSTSFDQDPYSNCSSQRSSNGDHHRKAKRAKNGKKEADRARPRDLWVPANSTTLMEAQEFGEMMEHVDEVNFALDGLNKRQPLRIRRASLLSLLSICATAQQRRLLRTQGMTKAIVDAIVCLSFDDSPSNMAAAAIFYVLTADGQEDHLLELPSSIHLLIKMLSPVTSIVAVDKSRNVGSKLLALHKDMDISRDTSNVLDISAAAIVSKVQEIIVSCKDTKSWDDGDVERPDFSPKWIALLTMEKACLSKISLEDTSGTIRKTGGNFKEKLRELGGLDAVFKVAMECHRVLETQRDSPSSQNARYDLDLQSLAILLKCLKTMENATFLSAENQTHLLGLKGNSAIHGSSLSFTNLIIRVIKILSAAINDATGINSSKNYSSTMRSSFETRLTKIPESRLCQSVPSCGTTTTSMEERLSIKTGLSSSTSDSCHQSFLKISISEVSGTSSFHSDRSNSMKFPLCELLEDSQDPFAFDEDEPVPSKWEMLAGKPKKHQKKRGRVKRIDSGYQLSTSQKVLNGLENHQNELCDLENNESLTDIAPDKFSSCLLPDCLLTAVKVLMNLTNENPVGCQQIASYGGLETMSLLIASHFPFFSSSSQSITETKDNTSSSELVQGDGRPISDQELDFLVAVLGLLVNLVEKDESNRSRLVAASVVLPGSKILGNKGHKDVISLLCSIFLSNAVAGNACGEENVVSWDDEAALLREEKEAEKMIVQAYAALLLAFLSTESKQVRDAIANRLPNCNLSVLVPVLERFVEFHLTLNMISPETHRAVSEVIESCKVH